MREEFAERLLRGERAPIGIPPYFLADQLARGVPAGRILAARGSLLAEYAGAQGYAGAWGHLIEERLGAVITWRLVPVRMWEETDAARRGRPLLIPDWITVVRPELMSWLAPRLPAPLLLTGCPPHARRHPHALLTLLTRSKSDTEARTWMAETLIPETLPVMLSLSEERVRQACMLTTLD